MYIYYGKLDYFEYAVDEPIIIVIPNDFVPNDPICGYWRWTKDPNSGQENRENVIKASSMRFPSNLLDISFVFGDYTFDAAVDQGSFNVTMSNATRDQVSSTNYLRLSYNDKMMVTSPRIYTAEFNWDEQNQEILTVVVPGGFVASGQPVCAYFRQIKEKDGKICKESNSIVTEFTRGGNEESGDEENEEVNSSFTGYDERTWVIGTADDPLQITGTQVPQGDCKTVPLVRNGLGSETARKALIVRYDVGTDDGIFRMRDLVHMLGFYETSVEMLYYNSEPQGGPRTCSSGQQAPTATRFKEKFAELLRNVQPGDVRFLYIDAHSSPRAEPGVDDGWELARDENGRRDEIVYGDWITRCINENLVRGVNLTILTPFGPGGCISDNTPGIIFAGCHEVQTSVKALNDMDPWTVAIAEVIERHKESCRPIPTHAQLYTSARKFITDWIRSGELSTDHYLGPSPDGANPDGSSSHQDPQLVFCEDHINVDTERFLCPLAREGWNNVGLAKRFPKDEL